MDNIFMDKSQLISTLPYIGLFISLVYLWLKIKVKKHGRYIDSAFLDAASIPSFRKTVESLNKELSRARRSHSPLSIIVIEHHPTESSPNSSRQDDSSKSPKSISRRKKRDGDITDFLLCGRVIRDALRDIDIISYAAVYNQFIIVLPESTKLEAMDALRRIKEIVGIGADQLLADVAEFPRDGLILDDLVAHAARLISNKNEGTIVASLKNNENENTIIES
jgi:hypothetical protein